MSFLKKTTKKIISNRICVISLVALLVGSLVITQISNNNDWSNKPSQIIVLMVPENEEGHNWGMVKIYDSEGNLDEVATSSKFGEGYRTYFTISRSINTLNGTWFVFDTPTPEIVSTPVIESSDFRTMEFWSNFPIESWLESTDLAFSASKYHVTYDHVEYDIWIVLR